METSPVQTPAPAPKKPVAAVRQLRIPYTNDARLELGKQLAEAHQNHAQIENDFATVKTDFKARLTAIEAKITDLSQKVGNGFHVGEVKCEWRFDTPKVDQKSLVRLDTNETVEVVDMTVVDKQGELPLAVPPATDAQGNLVQHIEVKLPTDGSGVVKVEADDDGDAERDAGDKSNGN